MDLVEGDPYRTGADPLGAVEVVCAPTRSDLLGRAIREALLPLVAAAGMGQVALANGAKDLLARVLCVLVVAALAGLAIWRFRVVSRLRLDRVAVHAEGVRLRTGDEQADMRWDEIVKLSLEWGRSPFDRRKPYHRIETADRGVDLSEALPDLPGLFERLSERIVARRLPGLLAAIGRGEDVTFGDVVLRREHLSLGGDRIPWSEVEELHVEDRRLRVVGTSGTFLRTAEVPEAPATALLLAIADRLMPHR